MREKGLQEMNADQAKSKSKNEPVALYHKPGLSTVAVRDAELALATAPEQDQLGTPLLGTRTQVADPAHPIPLPVAAIAVCLAAAASPHADDHTGALLCGPCDGRHPCLLSRIGRRRTRVCSISPLAPRHSWRNRGCFSHWRIRNRRNRTTSERRSITNFDGYKSVLSRFKWGIVRKGRHRAVVGYRNRSSSLSPSRENLTYGASPIEEKKLGVHKTTRLTAPESMGVRLGSSGNQILSKAGKQREQ